MSKSIFGSEKRTKIIIIRFFSLYESNENWKPSANTLFQLNYS